jgi:hypothetical protein
MIAPSGYTELYKTQLENRAKAADAYVFPTVYRVREYDVHNHNDGEYDTTSWPVSARRQILDGAYVPDPARRITLCNGVVKLLSAPQHSWPAPFFFEVNQIVEEVPYKE